MSAFQPLNYIIGLGATAVSGFRTMGAKLKVIPAAGTGNGSAPASNRNGASGVMPGTEKFQPPPPVVRRVTRRVQAVTQSVDELMRESEEYFEEISRQLGPAAADKARARQKREIEAALSAAKTGEFEVELVKITDADADG